ncbi:hypothetical protein ACFFQF_13905 [Haladaptatus pallidirubidus]|uniref:hypothetical protein n=1 Tax=Haladaptatus pallidirubidus TaxID=1008152 RepID=UPI0035E92B35
MFRQFAEQREHRRPALPVNLVGQVVILQQGARAAVIAPEDEYVVSTLAQRLHRVSIEVNVRGRVGEKQVLHPLTNW